jgi:hypothetical protein
MPMTANRPLLGDPTCDTWLEATGVATTDQNAELTTRPLAAARADGSDRAPRNFTPLSCHRRDPQRSL